MPPAMKVQKTATKEVPKAKASPKAKATTKAAAKGVAKAAPKAGSKASLTEETVRAHEKLMNKGLKSSEEVLDELKKMPKNEQEQVWKQRLSCNEIKYKFSLFQAG
jgi:hypothetical protein